MEGRSCAIGYREVLYSAVVGEQSGQWSESGELIVGEKGMRKERERGARELPNFEGRTQEGQPLYGTGGKSTYLRGVFEQHDNTGTEPETDNVF